MKKGFKIFVLSMVIIGMLIGVEFGWEKYNEVRIEKGAYEYLEENLYGDFSDLQVKKITCDGNDRYDIEYYYSRGENSNMHCWSYGVEL